MSATPITALALHPQSRESWMPHTSVKRKFAQMIDERFDMTIAMSSVIRHPD